MASTKTNFSTLIFEGKKERQCCCYLHDFLAQYPLSNVIPSFRHHQTSGLDQPLAKKQPQCSSSKLNQTQIQHKLPGATAGIWPEVQPLYTSLVWLERLELCHLNNG